MKTTLLLAITFLMTGCGIIPKYNKLEVNKTDVVYVTIPDELLKPCEPDKPLDTKSYLELKIWEREQVLTEYSISLLKTIKDCDLQITKIKELNTNITKQKGANNDSKP